MIDFYIVLGIAIILSLTFVFTWSKQRPILSFWLKGLATVSVLALAIVSISQNNNCDATAILFMIGLAFCMLGDVSLALIELQNEEKKEYIITLGMISFAIAQLFFIIGMSIASKFMPFPILGGIAFGALVYLLKKPMKLEFGKCLIPGLIYSILLSTSLFTAINYMCISSFNGSSIILTIAFCMFLVSDLILSQIYFGQTSKKHLLYIPNLSTYYTAIILIAISMMSIL